MTVDPTTHQLRQLLSPPPYDEDAAVDRLRALVDREIEGAAGSALAPVRARRRRRHAIRRPRLLLAGIVFALVAASAGAAELLDDPPVSQQLPAKAGGGWTELVDNAFGITRISIAEDDKSLCAEFDPSSASLGGGGMCGGRLPESGLNARWSCGSVGSGEPTQYAMNGIAASDVERITAETFAGDTVEVPIDRNTFALVVTDRSDAPKVITSVRNGREFSITSPPLGCAVE